MKVNETTKILIKLSMQSCMKSDIIRSILEDKDTDNEMIVSIQKAIRSKWSFIKRLKFKDAIPVLIEEIQNDSSEVFHEVLNAGSAGSNFFTDIILSYI